MPASPSFNLQPHLDLLAAQTSKQFTLKAQTPQELQAWQEELRAELQQLLGLQGRTAPQPHAEKLQTSERGNYVEEKYSLAVGENVQTPMYLLVPKNQPPFKTILVFHGHDASAQSVLGNYPDAATAADHLARDNNYAQTLAQAGYLVCVLEQRGFGERLSGQVDQREFPRSCRQLAFDYMLRGRNLLGERCWDGLCALDYLQTRSEVMSDALGCTGHSGGGATALWLSAIEPRITVSVPAGYFSSFQDSILGMPHCECNYVPGVLERVEMGELAALVTPRPLCLLNGERDPLFPIQSARGQFTIVQRAYALVHAAEKCVLAVHPGEHMYHHALSQQWFARWL